MRTNSQLGVISMLLFMCPGCAVIQSANKWVASRAALNGNKLEKESPNTEKRESPILRKGSDYDRESGVDYFWVIRENGTSEMTWQDSMSGDYASIVVGIRGEMFTSLDGDLWVYNTWSDTCSNGSDYMKGLRCIHPVVKHFFTNHEFTPPHPMAGQIK